MKNLIEGMISIVYLSVISIVLMSLVLTEGTIIQRRNDFYNAYEEALLAGKTGELIKSDPFTLEFPLIGKVVNEYTIEATTR